MASDGRLAISDTDRLAGARGRQDSHVTTGSLNDLPLDERE